ncbi:MAG: hypothetical protein ACRES7_00830 [Gammaproteobacteria bacterium]
MSIKMLLPMNLGDGGTKKRIRIRMGVLFLAGLPIVALVGCTCGVGVSQKQGLYAGCWTDVDPPANTLGSLDTTQAIGGLTTQNGTVENTSGTFTVTVSDTTTSEVLGETQFAYYISNNSIYAQDPTLVHTWLEGFSQYGNEDVTVHVEADDIAFQPTIEQGTATLTFAAKYQGLTYGLATLQEEINPPRCKPPAVNCQPKRPGASD